MRSLCVAKGGKREMDMKHKIEMDPVSLKAVTFCPAKQAN